MKQTVFQQKLTQRDDKYRFYLISEQKIFSHEEKVLYLQPE